MLTKDKQKPHRLSIAPMMDWTDRECRFFHRVISEKTMLYTEMVTAPAVIHGDRERLLGFDTTEHPVSLQLGGSDPSQLAQSAKIGADYGYDEINLNCGCPSDRVQSGAFGAILMQSPDLVADCVAAMIAAQPKRVTVKCRIGVDDQVPEDILPRFLEKVSAAGVTHFTIHARKAWLKGLSPKENRDIPPLDYPLVLKMKEDFPHLDIGINGGITSLTQAQELLDAGMDGVMIGRAAYHQPYDIMGEADRLIYGHDRQRTREEIVHFMLPHIEAHLAAGGRLHQITRHMLGLFAGRPGARSWRRVLSENASKPGAGPELVLQALASVGAAAEDTEAA